MVFDKTLSSSVAHKLMLLELLFSILFHTSLVMVFLCNETALFVIILYSVVAGVVCQCFQVLTIFYVGGDKHSKVILHGYIAGHKGISCIFSLWAFFRHPIKLRDAQLG